MSRWTQRGAEESGVEESKVEQRGVEENGGECKEVMMIIIAAVAA